jgi:NAD dependent epimerase/dehydratase family enzyme
MPLPAFALRAIFGDMADGIMLSGQQVIPARASASGYVFRYPDIAGALGAIFSV